MARQDFFKKDNKKDDETTKVAIPKVETAEEKEARDEAALREKWRRMPKEELLEELDRLRKNQITAENSEFKAREELRELNDKLTETERASKERERTLTEDNNSLKTKNNELEANNSDTMERNKKLLDVDKELNDKIKGLNKTIEKLNGTIEFLESANPEWIMSMSLPERQGKRAEEVIKMRLNELKTLTSELKNAVLEAPVGKVSKVIDDKKKELISLLNGIMEEVSEACEAEVADVRKAINEKIEKAEQDATDDANIEYGEDMVRMGEAIIAASRRNKAERHSDVEGGEA